MAIDMTQKSFWLVWNPDGSNPKHRHESEASAIKEAERLANHLPGQTFVVLESKFARRSDSLIRIDYQPDADIPF